jgi:hypothetical protein
MVVKRWRSEAKFFCLSSPEKRSMWQLLYGLERYRDLRKSSVGIAGESRFIITLWIVKLSIWQKVPSVWNVISVVLSNEIVSEKPRQKKDAKLQRTNFCFVWKFELIISTFCELLSEYQVVEGWNAEIRCQRSCSIWGNSSWLSCCTLQQNQNFWM